jgi:hypothetical protein
MGNVYNLFKVKTVTTAMLMVMSDMDPHMIRGNQGWVFVKSWLGCVKVGFIGVTEPPRGGVQRQDQLEQFSAKREHNQHP